MPFCNSVSWTLRLIPEKSRESSRLSVYGEPSWQDSNSRTRPAETWAHTEWYTGVRCVQPVLCGGKKWGEIHHQKKIKIKVRMAFWEMSGVNSHLYEFCSGSRGLVADWSGFHPGPGAISTNCFCVHQLEPSFGTVDGSVTWAPPRHA